VTGGTSNRMGQRRRPHVLTDRFPRLERREVDGDVLARVQSLYDEGRYLDAHVVASTAGPLQAWSGVEALVLGARLAGNIGAERVARLLILRAQREHPDHPRVALHYAYVLREHRGPMASWSHALSFERREDLSNELRADLIGLRATIAAIYRDFETAESLLDRAFALHPGSRWLLVEKAEVLELGERREEALAALDQALSRHAWYRPAIQYRARLLHILGRGEEAIAFLTQALEVIQSANIAHQLMQLKWDVDDEAGMLELLQRLDSLSPLKTLAHREWLDARTADALCLRRDFAGAATHARRVGDEYYPELASRLERATGSEKRVRLPFEFIPQGHNTCGPATLAAIARYWDVPATQEAIVDAISYGGTYDHSERHWCETNGFAAREFKVTWDSLRRLLDERVPFAMATVEVGSAHMQAVIGYDELRETLFIQDPTEPHYREVPAQEFLNKYALTGPRGMVLVPIERRAWLESLALPEAELFDLYYRVQFSLGAHRRDEAVAALDRLNEKEPGGRLALLARNALASFDGNTPERSRVLDELLRLLPDDQRLLAWRLEILQETGRREERLSLLRRAVHLEEAHPLFVKELAGELGRDIRHDREVRRLQWKAHRMLPRDSSVLVDIADWELRHGRNPDLLHLYRFSSAVSDRHEGLARRWFDVACAFGRSAEAIAWLRHRFDAFGGKSGAPAVTLSDCLDRMDRTEDAFEVLREAIARRPDDGHLLVHTTRLEVRYGRVAQAETHLEAARGHCSPRMWFRAQAELEARRGNRRKALSAWQTVLEHEPLALDARQEIAQQLACLEGEEAARACLDEACARFPHHYGLAQLRLRILRERGWDGAEPAARKLVEMHPEDPWALRELAIILKEAGRPAEALAFSQSALVIAPDQSSSHGIHGSMLSALGREVEAAEKFRAAIACDVNNGWACEALLHLLSSTEEKRTALEFIGGEMRKQVLNGNGLHAYHRCAYPVLEPQELARSLREIWDLGPDLWETWSVLAAQELDLGNAAEAERLASEAVKRFPLLPGAWRDLSTLYRHVGQTEEALRAIRRALELNPDWAVAWQEQAQLLEESGRAPESIELLRAAVQRLPLGSELRLTLATMLWRANEREQAWEITAQVVESEPGWNSAWQRLREWSPLLHRGDDLVAVARRVTQDRPGEARSWMILAHVLPLAEIEEELTAYDQAISCNPRLTEAYDLKAAALARIGRFDAARTVLEQGPWKGDLPMTVQGRLAWLRAERGEKKEAIAAMSLILEKNKDYYWGWERVSEWAAEAEDNDARRRSVKELIRLAPRDAGPYCHGASLEFELKNDAEALALLKRALQLEPDHGWAARRLMEYYWEKTDATGLDTVPGLVLQGGYTGWVGTTSRILAAALREDVPTVTGLLPGLITPADEIGALAKRIDTVLTERSPGLRDAYRKTLDAAVESGTVGASFAAIWVREQLKNRRWDCWKRFGDWIERLGERSIGAIAEFLDGIGEAAQASPAVPELIAAHGPWLRAHTLLWGKTGYALASSGLYADGADWLRGGESRPDAEGWMLANLVICLRGLGRRPEAGRISATVVQRGLRDDTWTWHVSQDAIAAALEGDHQRARATLALTPASEVSGGWSLTYALADSLSRVMAVAPSEARTLFREEHRRLARIARALETPSKALLAEYSESIERMRRHAGAFVLPWKRRYPGRKAQPPGQRKVASSAGIWAATLAALLAARACADFARQAQSAAVRGSIGQPAPSPAGSGQKSSTSR
jgi:tetratricopeptide (TPR) repeat protein